MKRQWLLLFVFSCFSGLVYCQGKVIIVPIEPKAAQPAAKTIEYPATEAQIREYVRLTKADEIFRVSWTKALDDNWTKFAKPYWPDSVRLDMRNEMANADLAPMIVRVYQEYIPTDLMQAANDFLQTGTMLAFAATPLGQKFCALQQPADAEGHKAILSLTTEILSRVYQRDEPLIKAARGRYLAANPDYKD